jgi:hypothetical protein
MDILCLEGTAPGVMAASIAHDGVVRRLALEVGCHAMGGWHARLPEGAWGLRCNAVATAILLEAAEVFAGTGASSSDDAWAIAAE